MLDESSRIKHSSAPHRHLEHVIKQEYRKGSFKVNYLPTAQMPADGFMKALDRQHFELLRTMLKIIDLRTTTLIYTLTKHVTDGRGGA